MELLLSIGAQDPVDVLDSLQKAYPSMSVTNTDIDEIEGNSEVTVEVDDVNGFVDVIKQGIESGDFEQMNSVDDEDGNNYWESS
jgi:hypothetical protein|tara:strand:- start:1011 stop:1262 length:252 start_codon:yes stop_codon:yes gene_type:complete